MKRLTAILCVLLTAAVTASAETYSDMPDENEWSYKAMSYAEEKGILTGFGDGSIRPYDKLTRAQTAQIAVRSFNSSVKNTYTGFTDVAETAWYYGAVKTAVESGFFNGTNDGYFLPENKITRQEVFAVTARAMGLSGGEELSFEDTSELAPWAEEPVKALAAAGYVHGDGNMLRPQSDITRAELAQLLYNIAIDEENKNGTDIQHSTPTPIPEPSVQHSSGGSSHGVSGGGTNNGDGLNVNVVDEEEGEVYSDDIF